MFGGWLDFENDFEDCFQFMNQFYSVSSGSTVFAPDCDVGDNPNTVLICSVFAEIGSSPGVDVTCKAAVLVYV